MDFTKSPEVLAIELVNAANGTTVDAADFDFGAPGAGAKEGFNATLTLTAKAGTGVQGSQTFNYNQIELTAVAAASGAEFEVAEGEDATALLAKINTAWGTAFTAEQLTGVVVPEETGPVTVTMAAGHLVFKGAVEITVTVPPKPDPELTDVLPETDLNGFNLG